VSAVRSVLDLPNVLLMIPQENRKYNLKIPLQWDVGVASPGEGECHVVIFLSFTRPGGLKEEYFCRGYFPLNLDPNGEILDVQQSRHFHRRAPLPSVWPFFLQARISLLLKNDVASERRLFIYFCLSFSSRNHRT